MRGWSLTAATIGLANYGLKCSSLPVYTGGERPAAGTVISQKRITGRLVLSAGNITIEKSCIQPTSAGQGLPLVSTTDNNTGKITTSPVTIRDSEIDGSLLSDYNAAFATGFVGIANVQNNYIHDVGSGIALMETGSQLSGRVEGNYVNNLRSWGDGATNGNHSDALTVRDFDLSSNAARQLAISNNRLDCDSGNDTGALFIQTYSGNISNVTIEGNLLEGKGYQLVLVAGSGHTYSNMKAINNRMTGTGWGTGYVGSGPGWTEQFDNYINDPTQTENKGQPVTF